MDRGAKRIREMEVPQNEEYFTSYEDLEVHELMLRDLPRQESYRQAILSNKSLFKDKTVLDVGSGTGILSIFCAQAGAKRVLAVEASNLAKLSRDVIKENNLEETITVFECMIEDFQLPGGVKVDIIVSEWMGFYLLHEGMLDSVLFARDHFLADDGSMFPESASIIVAPCSMPSFFEDWEDVNGVKMQAFGEQLRRQKSQKPEVIVLKQSNLLHEGEVMCWLDLKDVTKGDLDELFYKDIIGKGGQNLSDYWTINRISLIRSYAKVWQVPRSGHLVRVHFPFSRWWLAGNTLHQPGMRPYTLETDSRRIAHRIRDGPRGEGTRRLPFDSQTQ